MGVLDRILRIGEGRRVKAVASLVPEINAFEPEMVALSDEALRSKTGEFRQRLANGADLDDVLIEAFAVAREAANRTIGQRHYDVQLMGGAALHFGWIAEMKTGEGKTLVSTLPAYLNGLAGKGVHLITVNDYLAKRDAAWMGQIHRWLGLNVGLVVPDISSAQEKRAAYACDITYGINNEFGFDYLRDNMAMTVEAKVQRGHGFAIVDEVDSILIDEARTPLIISGRLADAAQLYYKFASLARGLERDVDYDVDEEKRHVAPLDSGIAKVEKALGVENLYDELSQNLVHQLQAALRAKELYKRDRDYLIADGEIKIVDEFTGRILEGRRWSEGLHQAVEAKEGVKIKEENQTLATITLQNYFRLYDKLSGMTGTAQTEAAEFSSTYNLAVVPIPTNRPPARIDQGDLIYSNEAAKFNAVVEDIAEHHDRGQPVLVGTVSVEKSEQLSQLLVRRGIAHEVLNAKQHMREAEIVLQAGRLGAVTVATNMAGRGVDILLGGNPEGMAAREVAAQGLDLETDEGQALYAKLLDKFQQECKAEGDKVRELGGLYVLGTERHESRRIDNQLRGRSGRQGDPGESRFYLSLEDELMRLFATGAMSWVMSKSGLDDLPIEAKMVNRAIERAQSTVEARNAEIRKNVLKYDEVMNEQRKVIYKLRNKVLEGGDLRDETIAGLETTLEAVVRNACVSDLPEDWDLEGLITEVREYFPTRFTIEDFAETGDINTVIEAFTAEAVEQFEQREATIGAENMRDIERQVMLHVIDTNWREHLYDMDYLQEGIHLRAMGQKDPLVEWQSEGFSMFASMMDVITDSYIKYVMHLEAAPAEEPVEEISGLSYSAPEDPVQGSSAIMAAAIVEAEATGESLPESGQIVEDEPVNVPRVKSAEEKVGRNDPCWCGSGKKFKLCHGN